MHPTRINLASEPGTVSVVSGLPRSGTSLVMQMLAAGGMPVLADAARPPDAHNPNGYFEFQPVRRTATDHTWVHHAAGKAVKVVHVLLPHLPGGYSYRVLLIHREIREVLASQQRMLATLGRRGADLPPDRLAEVFARQLRRVLDWAARQPNVALLQLHHRDLIRNPSAEANRINDFLGGALNVTGMTDVVDPSLYRQRHASDDR